MSTFFVKYGLVGSSAAAVLVVVLAGCDSTPPPPTDVAPSVSKDVPKVSRGGKTVKSIKASRPSETPPPPSTP